MLSSVLRSPQAVVVNIAIMRAFVRLREVIAANADLARRMADLERDHAEHRELITEIFEYICELQEPPEPTGRPIGFQVD
jgi:hypothetical protein